MLCAGLWGETYVHNGTAWYKYNGSQSTPEAIAADTSNFGDAVTLTSISSSDTAIVSGSLSLSSFSAEASSHFTVIAGGSLTVNGMITFSGFFDNKGSITISNSLTLNQTFTNNGTITNNGMFTTSQKVVSNGTITNNNSGTINFNQDFENSSNVINKGNFNVNTKITNSGSINNTGTFKSTTSEIVNTGTIENTGTISAGTSLSNNGSGSIENTGSGSISAQNNINNSEGASITNTGTISANGTITNSGTFDTTGGEVNGTITGETPIQGMNLEFTFTGSQSSDYADSDNWVNGNIPVLTGAKETDIYLQADCVCNDALSFNTAGTENITIHLDGHSLTVNNTMTLGNGGSVVKVTGTGSGEMTVSTLAVTAEQNSTLFIDENVTFNVATAAFGRTVTNNGELVIQSGNAEFTNYSSSSTGTIILENGAGFENTGNAGITVSEMELKGGNTLKGTGSITVTSATYTSTPSLTVLGTVTLPGSTASIGALTVGNGTASASLTLKGDKKASSVEIKSNATLVSGTDGDDNTFTVNGNWTNNGTFTNGSGKVVLSGTSQISGETSFYDLTCSGTVTAVSDITVSNTFTDSGSLEMSGCKLTLSGSCSGAGSVVLNGGELTGAGSGEITVSNLTLKAASSENTINGGTNGIKVSAGTYNSRNLKTTGKVELAAGTTGSLNVSSGTLTAGGDITASSVTIGTGATFVAASSSTIEVAGNWSNSGTFTANGSSVEFTANTSVTGNTDFGDVTFDGTASINGNNTFESITAAGLGGKSISVTGTQTVNGDLVLSGTSESSRLSVSGTSAGSFEISGNQEKGLYLSVSEDGTGPVVNGGTYTAAYSEISGAGDAPSGWDIRSADYLWQWTGAGSDDSWSTAANWNRGSVPANDGEALIPNGKAKYPKLSVAATVGIITIENNASLYLNGNNFSAGDWTNSGKVYSKGSETVSLTGTVSESGTWLFSEGSIRSISGLSYKNITVTGDVTSSSAVTLAAGGNLTIGASDNTSAKLTLSTASSITVPGTLTNYGTIVYSSTGRIKNSTAVINDAANSGTVELTYAASDAEIDSVTYANLKISNGTWKLSDAANVSGTLTIASGKQLDLIGYDLSAGTVVNNGTVKLYGNQTLPASTSITNGTGSTVEYYGTSSVTAALFGTTYENLTVGSNTTLTQSSAVTVNGALTNNGTINAGANLSFGTGGTITNNGTITVSGVNAVLGKNDGAHGLVKYTANNTISDFGTTDFYNLEITGATVGVNTDITVNGDVTNNGTIAVAAGKKLTVKGDFDDSASTAFSGEIEFAGTADQSFTAYTNRSYKAEVNCSSGKKVTFTNPLELEEFTLTSGNVSFANNVTIDSYSDTGAAGTLNFDGTVTFSSDTTIETTGNITAASTVASDGSLTVSDAKLTAGGNVTAADDLELNEVEISGATVSIEGGSITINDDILPSASGTQALIFSVSSSEIALGGSSQIQVGSSSNKFSSVTFMGTGDVKTSLNAAIVANSSCIFNIDVESKAASSINSGIVSFIGSEISGEDLTLTGTTITFTDSAVIQNDITVTGSVSFGDSTVEGSVDVTGSARVNSGKALTLEGTVTTSGGFTNNGTIEVATSGTPLVDGTGSFTNASTGQISSSTSSTEAALYLETNFTDSGSVSDDVKLVFQGDADLTFAPGSSTYKEVAVPSTYSNTLTVSTNALSAGKITFEGGTVSAAKNITATDDAVFENVEIPAGATDISIEGDSLEINGYVHTSGNSTQDVTLTSGSEDLVVHGDIGSSTNYVKTLTLNAGSNDIITEANIYTTNIDVTCHSVFFEDLVYVGTVGITATDIVSINGLKAESLTISNTAQKICFGSTIELTGSSAFTINYNAYIIDDVEFKASGNFTIASGGKLISATQDSDTKTVTAATASSTDHRTVTINSTGTNTLGVAGSTTAFTDGYTSLVINKAATINAENTFPEIEINAATTITDSNTIDSLTVAAGQTVTFGSGKLQKIGAIETNGTESSGVTLKPSSTGNWLVNFTTAPERTDFNYTTVQKATSVDSDGTTAKELDLYQVDANLCDATPTAPGCVNWFTNKFYWKGTSATGGDSWTNLASWSYDEDGDYPAQSIPEKTGSTAKIQIATGTGNKSLNLGSGVSGTTALALKEFTLPAGYEFELGSCTIAASNTITINGTVKLYGTQDSYPLTATSGVTFGNTSTIEYNGTATGAKDVLYVSQAGTVNSYKNLLIGKTGGDITFEKAVNAVKLQTEYTQASNCTITFNEAVTVTGTSDSVIFGGTSGTCTVSAVKKITANSLQVMANASLTLGSEATAITSTVTNVGTITTGSGTVGFNGELINSGTVTLSTGAVTVGKYTGSSGTLTGSSTTGTITFNGSTLGFGTYTPDKEKTVFAYSGTQTLTVADSSTASFADVQINSGTTLTTSSDFTVAGDWTNNGSFTATGSSVITFTSDDVTVSGENTFITAAFTTDDAQISIPASNAYTNLSFTGAGATVKFGAGETQTVSTLLKSVGTSAKHITLTTDAVSPSTTSSTWWILDITEGFAPAVSNFTYTDIEYSTSTNDIRHEWGATVTEKTGASTGNWFYRDFYWFGKVNNSWSTAGNWWYTEEGTGSACALAPDSTSGISNIYIKDNDSGVLTLTANIDVSTITVDAGKSIDFADKNVTATTVTNNGTVKLKGASTQTITASMVNGTGSTVEYYGGSTAKLVWDGNSTTAGNQFVNVKFADDATLTEAFTASGTLTVNGAFTSSGDISVTGAATVNSAVTDAVSVSGKATFGNTLTVTQAGNVTINNANNTFGGTVTLTSAKDVELNAGSLITIADGASVQSLTADSAVKIKGVSSTAGQDYKAAVTIDGSSATELSAGSTSAIEFESTLTGNNAALTLSSGTVEFSSNVSSVSTLTLDTDASNTATVQLGATEVVNSSGKELTAAYPLTITGKLTNEGTVTATQAVTVNGAIENSGTITGTTLNAKGNLTDTETISVSTLNFNGTASAQTFTVNAAKTYTTITNNAVNGLSVTNNLKAATVTNNKALTLNASSNLEVTTVLTNNSSVSIGANTLKLTAYTAGTDSTVTAAGGTITSTGTAEITIPNLTVGTSSSASSVTINGSTNGIKLTDAEYNSSAVTTTGAVKLCEGTAGAVTVTSGAASTTGELTAASLQITAGSFTAGDDLTISGNVTVSNGAVLNCGSESTDDYLIKVGGNWINNAGTTGFVNNAGTVEFTGNTQLSGSTEFNKVQFDGNAAINADNTFGTLIADGLGGKTFTFAADTTQTVTSALTLKGTSATNLLELKSAAEGSLFNLECTCASSSAAIQYISSIDCENKSSYRLEANDSTDKGNNIKWDFIGHTYTWNQTAADTDWNTQTNWTPASVPGLKTKIVIPTGASKYPKLTENLSLGTDSDDSHSTITINGEFDIQEYNVTCNKITNNGLLKLKGTASPAQTITAKMVNGTGSTVEYYGSSITKLVWDGDSGAGTAGHQFEKVLISNAASFTEQLAVNNTTVINTSASTEDVTLSNSSNSFAQPLTVTQAGDLVLASNGTLNIAGVTSASSIDVTGAVTLSGNVNTAGGTQLYNNAVTLGNNSTLTGTTVTFNGTVNGAKTLSISGNAEFDGTVGNSTPVASIAVTGTTDVNTTAITTSDSQTYTLGVTTGAGSGVTFTGGSGKLIWFKSTLTGDAENITINTANVQFDGAVNNIGALEAKAKATVNADIGTSASQNVASITVFGITEINTDQIKTTDSQTYTQAVTLSGSTATKFTGGSGKLVKFGSTLTGNTKAVTIETANAEFDGAVTNTESLTVDGTAVLKAGSITTSGNQLYKSAVTLSSANTLSGEQITFDSTVNGNYALNITGNAVLNGTVGNTAAPSSLSVSGTTDVNTTAVKTGGSQTYTQAVTITKNDAVTFTGGNSSLIWFKDTFTGSTKDVTVSTADVKFDGAVNKIGALVLGADAVFNADAGTASSQNIVSISVSGETTLNTANIKTTGAQSYTGAVTSGAASLTLTASEITSGTSFTAPSGSGTTLTLVTPSVNFASSDFVNNNGSVVLSYAGNVSLEIKSGDEFYNLATGTGTVLSTESTFTVLNEFDNKNTFTATDGTITFGSSSNTATIKGSSTFYKAVVLNSTSITGSNNYTDFTAQNLAGKTITFTAGTTQKVTDKLTLYGTSSSYLKLVSSSAGSQWKIDCTKTTAEPETYHDVKYVDIADSNNISTGYRLTSFNSTDSGNNDRWNFRNHDYKWTGTNGTDWFDKLNWNIGSVPGVGALVEIPAGLTNYPLLERSFETGTSEYASVGTNGTITVVSGAEFDLQGNSIIAQTVTNNGLLRLKGTSTQSITAKMVNGTGSTVEYYGNSITNLVWDGDNGAGTAGHQFEKVLISNAATISEQLAVNNTTVINTSTAAEAVTLSNTSNNFAQPLTVTQSGDLVLASNGSLNIAVVTSAASIDVTGAVKLSGNVNTNSGAQLYRGTVTLLTDSTLTGSTVTFNDKLSGTHKLTINADTRFNASVGEASGYELTSIDVSGETEINTGIIKTTGGQTYSDDVTVLGSSALSITGGTGSTVKFTGKLTGNTNNITVNNAAAEFDSTVDKIGALVLNADATFKNKVGSLQDVASISVTGKTYIASAASQIKTTGSQTYSDAAAVSTSTPTVFTAGSSALVHFKNTFTGNSKSLTIEDASVEFDGAVTAIENLVAEGPAYLKAGTINAGGTQTYESTVELYSDNELTGTTVTFNGKLYGGYNLKVNGKTVFNETVGETASKELAGLVINGVTEINTGVIKTTGNQTYSENVTVTASGTSSLSITGGTDKLVKFENNFTGNGNDFTVNTAAVEFDGTVNNIADLTAYSDATFKSPVGTGTAVNSITVNGKTDILTTAVTTTGAQNYTGAVTSGSASLTLTASQITSGTSFAAPTGSGTTLTLISPAVDFSSSEFTHNSGTVLFNYAGSVNFAVKDNQAFYIFVNGTSTTLTTASNFTVVKEFENKGTFEATAGTVSFGDDSTEVSIKGENTFYDVSIKNSARIYESNTYHNFTAAALESKTITFQAGKTQTVTNRVNVYGTSEGRLKLVSSTEGTKWYIDCTYNTSTPHEYHNITWVEIKDSYNSSANYRLTSYNSRDNGNNYRWNFVDQRYEWNGTNGTDWFEPLNWDIKSIPGIGAIVTIPVVANGNYPVIEHDFTLDDSEYDTIGSNGTITIDPDAYFDLQDKSIIANTVTNNGYFKLKGLTGQTINSKMINGQGSTVEYYGGATVVLAWDGDNGSNEAGKQYANLIFKDSVTASDEITTSENFTVQSDSTSSAAVTVEGNLEINAAVNFAEKVSVTGETFIYQTSGKNITLNNSENIFTGAVTAGIKDTKKAGNVILNSKDGFKLADNAYADTITVNSPVTLMTVTTTGSQEYHGTITGYSETDKIELNAPDVTLTDAVENALYIRFNADVTATGGITIVPDAMLNGNLDGDGLTVFKNDFYLVKQTSGEICSATVEGNFVAATSYANEFQINGDVTAGNFVLYTGSIALDGSITTVKDIVLLGSDYNTTDSVTGVSGEFEYNQTRPSMWNYDLEQAETDGMPDGTVIPSSSAYNGKLTVQPGCYIRSGKNFYANGIELTGSGEWFIDIQDVSDSHEGFAEAYNSTPVNATVRLVNGSSAAENSDKAQIAAVCDTAGSVDASCKNWDYQDFTIVDIHTVRDNTVRIEFSAPIRNRYDELTAMIGYFKYSSDGTEISYSGVYSDADCLDSLNHSASDVETKVIFVKASEGDSWNTDATGKSAGTSESTNRSGEHKNVIPYVDLPRALNGENYIVTDKWGKRLNNYSKNTPVAGIAYGSTSDSVNEVFDKTGPSLYSVRTGQELHVAPDSTASNQKTYDAHNFIEFRYSEKVQFAGTGDDTELNTDPSTAENVIVTDAFGALQGTDWTAKGELSFAGLGKIQNGQLYTGKRGSADKYVNSLYRKDEYSICLCVAGYVDGTVTDPEGHLYHNWTGYTEKAVMPTGSVDFVLNSGAQNTFVLDMENNFQEKYAENYIPQVNSTESGLYGAWDISEPIFAPLRQHTEISWEPKSDEIRGDSSAVQFEAIGNTSGVGSTLDRIEFHLFDNTPDYSSVTDAQWISEIGWVEPGKDTKAGLYRPYTYSADVFGGSRQFDADESRRTSGGVRYSSLYGSSTAFTYASSESGNVSDVTEPMNQNFSTDFYSGASSLLFSGSSMPRRSSSEAEGLHFALALQNRDHNLNSGFRIKYDDTKGFITDLAGNRLRGNVIHTIDKTPPSFNIALSPINQKEVYVVFVKRLITDSANLAYKDNDGNQINVATGKTVIDAPDPDKQKASPATFEQLLPDCFKLITIDDAGNPSDSTSVQIDINKPAVVMKDKSNNSFTCFKLYLTENLTLDAAKNLYLCLKNPDSFGYGELSTDISTLQQNARVTFIQDENRNYMEMYSAHSLTDFIIGAINPRYAYDASMTAQDADGNVINLSENIWGNAEGDASWAVHDWGRDQKNYGTLPAEHPLTIVAATEDGTESKSTVPVNVRMYLSNNPTEGSVSTQYNKDLKEDWRIWLPDVTKDVYSSLAEKNNKNTVTVDAELMDSEDKTKGLQFNILEPVYQNWVAGDQVSFMFGLLDDSGKEIMKWHSPEIDVENEKHYVATKTKYPLYAMRLTNELDITSLDLWSFRLKTSKAQRGGVSVMNNVLNVSTGEKAIIKLNVKKPGKVSVIVMTLDGSVVSYLNRSELYEGEHNFTWDGRNSKGNPVARGLYFIRVIGNDFDETRKIMVIK